MPSARSSAPSAPTSTAACASTCSATRLGAGPGDLRGGSAPRRRAGRRAHPGRAAPRHGHGEALRLQLDGERPLQGRRHRRRAGAPRGVPPALQAHRRRGRGVRDERVQRGQRRVVRREPHPAHRDPARRVGLRRLRDQRLDLRPARRRSVHHRRPRRRDARADDPAHRPARRPGQRRRSPRPTSTRASPARWPRCSATTPTLDDPGARRGDRGSAMPTGPWPGRRPPRGSCCSATCPPTDEPLLPLDPASVRRVAVLGPLAAVRNLGDGGLERRVGHHRGHAPRRARRRPARCRRARSSPTSTTRRDAPTWPSWWSATPAPTRASSSATPAPSHLVALMPGPDDPDEAAELRARIAAEGEPLADPTPRRRGRRQRVLHRRRPAVAAPEARDEALIDRGGGRQPPHGRGRDLRQRRADGAVAHTVPAIVQLWYAGMEGGHALADVLLGATSTPPAACRSRSPPTRRTSRRSIPTPMRSPTTAGTATGSSPASATRPASRSASGSPTRPGRSAPPRSTTTARRSSCEPRSATPATGRH